MYIYIFIYFFIYIVPHVGPTLLPFVVVHKPKNSQCLAVPLASSNWFICHLFTS